VIKYKNRNGEESERKINPVEIINKNGRIIKMKKVILVLLFLGMVGLLSSCTLSLDFHPEGKKAETTK